MDARRGRARLTLRPGDPGTKHHVLTYGEALVAVRYRYDEEAMRRYTTVEVVVDDRPWAPQRATPGPDAMVGVQIRYEDEAMRRAAREMGARWDAEERVWWMTVKQATRLGLTGRIRRGPALPPKISNTR